MNNLQTVDLNTAQEKLPELVEQAMRNRPVMITRKDVPVVELRKVEVMVAVKKKKSKKIQTTEKGNSTKRDYAWLDELVGAVKATDKRVTYSSQNVDEIYYR